MFPRFQRIGCRFGPLGSQPYRRLRYTGDAERRGIVVFGSGVVALLGLGSWQLYRRQWKQGITADREAKVRRPPRPLEELIARDEPLLYRPVTVRGVYDYSRQIFLGPRNLEGGAGGDSGFYLIVPLRISLSGEDILVNRGWVSRTRRKVDPVCAETEAGEEVEVEGLLTASELRNRYLQGWEPTGEKKDWIVLDIPAIHRHLNTHFMPQTEYLILEAHGGNPKDITRKDPQAHLSFKVTPESHLVYAATWYSLAACLTLITFKRFR